jgi:hypothetical protein
VVVWMLPLWRVRNVCEVPEARAPNAHHTRTLSKTPRRKPPEPWNTILSIVCLGRHIANYLELCIHWQDHTFRNVRRIIAKYQIAATKQATEDFVARSDTLSAGLNELLCTNYIHCQ